MIKHCRLSCIVDQLDFANLCNTKPKLLIASRQVLHSCLFYLFTARDKDVW